MNKPAKNLQPEPAPPATEEPKQAPAISPPETQTTTALALVTRSLTDLKEIAASVAALEQKYKGVVFDVKTTAGMKAACEARLAIRKPRYTIQTMQKDAKASLNSLKKAVDDQAEAVITRIAAIEDPVHEQISNEEKRKEEEKKAREEAERARVAAIQARIEEIRHYPLDAVDTNSAGIEGLIKRVVELAIDDSFAELKQQAEGAKATSLIRLRAALAKAQALETEQKRLAEERAAFLLQQAEEEKRQAAERARLAEEERVAREARQAEAAKHAEALRLEREENDRTEAERRAAREAEDRRLAAERAATEKAAADERARLAAERAEADRIEAERVERHMAQERRLAEERAEADRIEAKRRAAAEAEERRIAGAREQLERDQEALRVAQERAAAPAVVDEPTAESGSVAQTTAVETSVAPEPDPLLMTIRLTEYLPMQDVCRYAKEWAVFQEADSKADQKTDRKLAARAREAVNNLLIAVEQLL